MSLLRAIAVVLIVLGCAAFSQTCLIATMSAERAVDCCEHEEPANESGGTECAQCVTLESGVNRVTPELVVVAGSNRLPDEILSAMMAHLLEAKTAVPEVDTSQPVLTPLWQLVVRTALPVRGPSLVA